MRCGILLDWPRYLVKRSRLSAGDGSSCTRHCEACYKDRIKRLKFYFSTANVTSAVEANHNLACVSPARTGVPQAVPARVKAKRLWTLL